MNTIWIRALFSRTNILHRSAGAALVIGTAAVLSGCGGGSVASTPHAANVNAPSSTKLDPRALRHASDLRSSSVPSTVTFSWSADCFDCSSSDIIYWNYSGADGNVYTQSFAPNPTNPFQTAVQTVYVAGNTPPGTYYINVTWNDAYGCYYANACGSGYAIVNVQGSPTPPPTPTPTPGGGGGGRCIEAVRTGGLRTPSCVPPRHQPL